MGCYIGRSRAYLTIFIYILFCPSASIIDFIPTMNSRFYSSAVLAITVVLESFSPIFDQLAAFEGGNMAWRCFLVSLKATGHQSIFGRWVSSSSNRYTAFQKSRLSLRPDEASVMFSRRSGTSGSTFGPCVFSKS